MKKFSRKCTRNNNSKENLIVPVASPPKRQGALSAEPAQIRYTPSANSSRALSQTAEDVTAIWYRERITKGFVFNFKSGKSLLRKKIIQTN